MQMSMLCKIGLTGICKKNSEKIDYNSCSTKILVVDLNYRYS